MPCIQLSLVNSLDSSEHIKIGKALSGLEYDNLLVSRFRVFVPQHEGLFFAQNSRDGNYERGIYAVVE